MTVKLIMRGAFALVALILLFKLLRPYPLPEAQTVLPPPVPVFAALPGEELLLGMRSNNIWDPAREDLSVPAPGQAIEAGQGSTENALEPGAASDDWRLLAVSSKGGDALAVIKSHQGTNTYRVGGELPDGAIVVEIAATGITVERAGIEKSVYLFGKK